MPKLKILIEKDANRGYGYQVHTIEGPINKLYGAQPGVYIDQMQRAVGFAKHLLAEYNEQHGTHLEPKEVIGIDEEAYEANASRDIDAARGWKEIQSGRFDDVQPSPIDAEDIYHANVHVHVQKVSKKADEPREIKINITPEGIFLTLIKSWIKDQQIPKAERDREYQQVDAVVGGFCKLLAAQRIGKSATQLKRSLAKKDEKSAVAWVDTMFKKYHVTSRDLMPLLAFMRDDE